MVRADFVSGVVRCACPGSLKTGQLVATGRRAPAHVQGKDATLEWSSFVPQGASDAGSYTVDGQVLSVDGHQSDFRLTFTVQHAAPTQPAPGDGVQGGDGGSGE